MAKTAFVVGGDGQIGRALVSALRSRGWEVQSTVLEPIPPTDAQWCLDLSQETEKWLLPSRVEAAFLCAAIPSLAQCRNEPALTACINVAQTLALAQRLIQRGAFVLVPSTNLVFDGEKSNRSVDDAVCPKTEYGRQKADLEKGFQQLGASAAVIRLTKVIGESMPLFENWRRELEAGNSIRPFSDMKLAPVSLALTVEVMIRIVEQRCPGLFQLSPPDELSYSDAAYAIARALNKDSRLIQPILAAQSPQTLEHVPRYGTLDVSRVRDELGIVPPPSRTVIAEWIERRLRSGSDRDGG